MVKQCHQNHRRYVDDQRDSEKDCGDSKAGELLCTDQTGDQISDAGPQDGKTIETDEVWGEGAEMRTVVAGLMQKISSDCQSYAGENVKREKDRKKGALRRHCEWHRDECDGETYEFINEGT